MPVVTALCGMCCFFFSGLNENSDEKWYCKGLQRYEAKFDWVKMVWIKIAAWDQAFMGIIQGAPVEKSET